MENDAFHSQESKSTPPAQPYEGTLDSLRNNTLYGWAWDRNNPGEVVEIEIFSGDIRVNKVLADGFREDLLVAGKGDGKHAFHCDLSGLLEEGDHRILIMVAESDYVLVNSPILVKVIGDEISQIDVEIPLPPRPLCDHELDDYLTTSFNETLWFRNQLGLHPKSKILDVGCGTGRLARNLINFLDPRYGEYHGMDIYGDRLLWAKEHIGKRFTNFHFQHVDMYSAYFNPSGKIQVEDYRFPFPDGYFDFMIYWSVYTHILPDVAEVYTRETGRLLKSGCKCVLTCYLWTEDTQQAVQDDKPDFDFKYDFGSYRAQWEDTPEEGLSYKEAYLLELLQTNNLRIVEKQFGPWRQRRQEDHGQDILVLEKV